MSRVTVCGALFLAAGCGGDDGGDAPLPLVGEIDEAVVAVEEELGGPQQYFEITATPQQVRMFVAVDDASAVRSFVYIRDELAPAGERQSAEGQTFGSEQLDFDRDAVFDQVTSELPDLALGTFSVIGAGSDGVQYGIYGTSERGGRLDIIVDGDGTVLSAGAAGRHATPVPTTQPSTPSPGATPPASRKTSPSSTPSS